MPRVLTISESGRVATVLVDLSMTAPWYRHTQVPVVVDLDTGRLVGPVERDPDVARAVVSPGGERVAIGGFDGSVGVRRVADGRVSVLAAGGQPEISALGWSGDGRQVYAARSDGRVDVLDVATASLRASLVGHGVAVGTLREVALADGPGLTTLDDSGVVIMRTLGASTALGARRDVPRPQSVALLAGGGPVLVGQEGGIVAVYERSGLARDGELRLESGRFTPPSEITAIRRRVTALAAANDGRSVVAADRTGRLTVWSWPDRAERWTRDDAPAAFLGVSPDGTTLVTAELALAADDPSPDGFPETSWIRLWDMATGTSLARFDSTGRKPRAVAVPPDSRSAVVGFFDEGVEVIDIGSRQVVRALDSAASALAYTPDCERLIVVDFEGHGRVFSTEDWAEVGQFSTLASGYAHLVEDAEARMMFLASASEVAVWDTVELRRLAPRLSVRGDGTNDGIFLALADDEPVMAVASQAEVALVDLRESTWRNTACRIANRQLTEDEWARLLPDRPYAPSCA